MSEGKRLYLGIEIGGTKLQVFAGDGFGKILERHTFKVDKSAAADGIRSQLEKTIPELSHRLKPASVGVGFGGPVDSRTGRICCSHQIEGWSEFPLGDWLQKLSDASIRVDNDANVGALGEATHGAGAEYRIVFYVTLGSGVGGGLVIDKKIYHGALPGESEIGHVRLDRAGTIVEQRCSGWAVDARLREAAVKNPTGALARVIGNAAANEAKFLNATVQAGDANAKNILDEVCDDLAFALSHVSHLFHPEIIVLGGGLSLVGEPLRSGVEKRLSCYLMEAFAPGPKIALAQLREDVVPVGALRLATGL